MNLFVLKAFKYIPLITLMYSFWVLFVCLGILHDKKENYFFFLFLSFQVYINWITIVCISSNCTYINDSPSQSDLDGENITLNLLNNEVKTWGEESSFNYESALGSEKYLTKLQKKNEHLSVSNVEEDFRVDPSNVWYCPKCCQRTSQTCYHCPICNKCVVERDHHCFFIGSCITKQNMKHFVVLLFYTSITSFYAAYLVCEEMNLFHAAAKDWSVIYRHFLPVSFALYLGGGMILHNVLSIALLNTSACLAMFALAFFVYNLYLICTGKMLHRLQRRWIIRDRSVVSKNPFGNFSLIFGNCGLMNFFMPVGFAHNVLKIHLQ